MTRSFVILASLLAGCTQTGKIPLFDTTDTGDSGTIPDSTDTSDTTDTGDSGTAEPFAVSWDTVFSGSLSSYFLDMAYSDSLGEFLLADPAMDRLTGGIYQIGPDTVVLPDEAVSAYLGDTRSEAFGVAINLLTWNGVEYLASNQYGDSFQGRLLAAPLTEGYDGAMSDIVDVLDVSGETEGTDMTGGYFGTKALLVGDKLAVSQTNGATALYSGPASMLEEGGTIDDFDARMDGDPASGFGDGGYVGTDMAADEAGGFAVSSEGGVLQHFTADFEPDWWVAGTDDPVAGAYDFPASERDTQQQTRVAFVNGTYAMGILSEPGYASVLRFLDPETGEDLADPEENAFSYAEGKTAEGLSWKATSRYEYYDASGDAGGWLRIESDDGRVLEATLPLESPYNCFLQFVSDGAARLGWFCKGGNVGGIATITGTPRPE